MTEELTPTPMENFLDDTKESIDESKENGKLEEAINAAASYIVKIKEDSMLSETIRERDKELEALRNDDPEKELQFVRDIAKRTIAQGWFDQQKDMLKLLTPVVGPMFFAKDKVKDMTWAFMIITGMIGSQEAQEEFASLAGKGWSMEFLKVILPAISMFAKDPETKAAIKAIETSFQIQEDMLAALAQLRSEVQEQTEVHDVQEHIEDDANHVVDAA